MDLHCQMLMEEFRENLPVFETIKTVVLSVLKNELDKNGISVTGIEGRVKEEKSFAGKLERKGQKYHTLSDITDIFGARIITFYTFQVDKIMPIIEKTFDVDRNESVDKRKTLNDDQFGYLSVHYICRIPETLYRDEKHPEINHFRFEIQIRTALQHVWAATCHKIGYKSDIEIPREYSRALSRLSGLLELADEEFARLMLDISDYRRKVTALIKDGRFRDVRLDRDSFEAYLQLKPFRELNKRIAAINAAEIMEQSLVPYYEVFISCLHFENVADIEDMLQTDQEDAFRLATLQIGDKDLDILAETVGVQNLCIVHIAKQGGGRKGLLDFLDLLYGTRSSNESTADRLVKELEKLQLM